MLQKARVAEALGMSTTIMKDENADGRTGLCPAKKFFESMGTQGKKAVMRFCSELELHDESE